MVDSFQSRFLSNLQAINAGLGGSAIALSEPRSFESDALLMLQAIALAAAGAATTAEWSGITGDLVDQDELNAALQSKQNADGDLSAIAALTGSGFLQRTGADAWALAVLSAVALSGNYNDLTNKPDLSAFDEVLPYANLAAFPLPGTVGKIYVADDTGLIYRWSGLAYVELSAGGGIWGKIVGSLSSQTDLQAALNAKQAASAVLSAIAAITSGTGLLQRNGATGQWALSWQSLSQSPDVAIANPASGQILQHNGTEWVNMAMPSVGAVPASISPPVSPSEGDRWLQLNASGHPVEEWFWYAVLGKWLSVIEYSKSHGTTTSSWASNNSNLAYRYLELDAPRIALTAFGVPFSLNAACTSTDFQYAYFSYQHFVGTTLTTSATFFTANTQNYDAGSHYPKWIMPSPYIPPHLAYRVRMAPGTNGSPPTVNYPSPTLEVFYRRAYS